MPGGGTMKGLGIGLLVVGGILGVWSYAWGHTGYYQSQAGAVFALAFVGLVMLVGGGILLNRAIAAERLERTQGGVMMTAVAPVAPAEDPLIVSATDPSTPQATLADLAYKHPQTRAAVAANPAAYPALLDWLSQFDDPAIKAALAARHR